MDTPYRSYNTSYPRRLYTVRFERSEGVFKAIIFQNWYINKSLMQQKAGKIFSKIIFSDTSVGLIMKVIHKVYVLLELGDNKEHFKQLFSKLVYE